MKNRSRHLLLFASAALVVASSTLFARHLWQEAAMEEARQTGETRAEIVAETLRNAVTQNQHWPLVMALDPDVARALEVPNAPSAINALNQKLEVIEKSGSPAALYVMDSSGETIAASNWRTEGSFVGQYYGFRSYFTEAIQSGQGSYFGIGVTTGRAGYFVARAVGEPDPIGVAVAKIEFDDLESTWSRASEEIMVTDSNDIIFLSGRPEWKYRSLTAIDETAISAIESTRQYAGAALEPLATTIRAQGEIWIEGLPQDKSYLRQTVALPDLGWTVHQLTDMGPVSDARRDGTVIGATGSALIVAILFFLAQRQRRLSIEQHARAELEVRVAERTSALRDTNAALETEVIERRRTEKELRSAQDDLIQAGKLAALGQMSAAIAHEINQPLTAMRTYLATTRIFVPLGEPKPILDNLEKVDTLAVRMGRITSHLKTFARKEGMEPPEVISVSQAVQRALDLIEVQAHSGGVAISQSILAAWTMGNEVRLEQVVINLVRNALDAVADRDDPRILVAMEDRQDRIAVIVSDNGPGFAPDVLTTLFDPFVTTKPSGAGLGLGLTISYEIIREFGGTLRADNHPEGGAVLTIELAKVQPPVTQLETTANG